MTKLYIIGNGFDKHHKLPTGYNDFHQFVIDNNTDLENNFEEYFQLRTKNSLWSDFENDLATFKWKNFFDEKNNLDVQDESFRPSFVFGLEDDLIQETDDFIEEISAGFEDWLNHIQINSIDEKFPFDKESIFLTFNYTLTLEEVYKIPSKKILHIHGDIENNQGCLIFGHNEELKTEPELDENGDSNRTMFTDSEAASKSSFYALKKPVSDIIRENKSFFENLSNISDIIILGHSLNSVDIPYFVEIKKYAEKMPKWNVSFHEESEKETHLKALQEIGVIKSCIKFFKME